MSATIDFRRVAEGANLEAIITDDLGHPEMIARKPHWRCPWHNDSAPSLYLFDGGKRWRCWPCGITGDAIDWLTRREGVSAAEAARMIDPRIDGPDDRPTPRRKPRRSGSAHREPEPTGTGSPEAVAPDPTPTPEPAPADPWQTEEWQAAAGEIIERAAEVLWGLAGRDALAWLRGRGLADDTIARFRLGFLDDGAISAPLACLAGDDGRPRPIRASRGIVIPWAAPGGFYGRPSEPVTGPRWVGANVRRLMPDVGDSIPKGQAKCLALAGSIRGHAYPWPEVLPSQGRLAALIVEGEIDALLAFQELGPIVHVVTVGGASQTPRPEALELLAGCPAWLIATDHDAAGSKAAQRFAELDPFRAKRLFLPAKDVGEFVQAGGDLKAWLSSEFRRLGLPWPLRSRPADPEGGIACGS